MLTNNGSYKAISSHRQSSMDKSTAQLFKYLEVLKANKLIDDFAILEDSQSEKDIEEGIDFWFQQRGREATASAKITYNCPTGNYMGMRAIRDTGNSTELQKRLADNRAGRTFPVFMFHFFGNSDSKNSLNHFYVIPTKAYLNYYKLNKSPSAWYRLDNSWFYNAPVDDLEGFGVVSYVLLNGEIVKQ